MKLNILHLLLENKQKLAAVTKMISKMLLDANKPDDIEYVARVLLNADPTNHKEFSLWLAKLFNNGLIAIPGTTRTVGAELILPEDTPHVTAVLTAYTRAKKSRRLPPNQRDITKFDSFRAVDEIVTALIQNSELAATPGAKARSVPGAIIVYDTAPYTVYAIPPITDGDGERSLYTQIDYQVRLAIKELKEAGQTVPDVDLDRIIDHRDGVKPKTPGERQRVKALEILGMGPPATNWCTREGYGNHSGSRAAYYLGKGVTIVIYKDGQPFIQKNGSQIKDNTNYDTTIPPELEKVVDRAEVEHKDIPLEEQFDLGEQPYTPNEIQAKEEIILATHRVFRNKKYADVAGEGYGILTRANTRLHYNKIVDKGDHYLLFSGRNGVDGPYQPAPYKYKQGFSADEKAYEAAGLGKCIRIPTPACPKTPEEAAQKKKALLDHIKKNGKHGELRPHRPPDNIDADDYVADIDLEFEPWYYYKYYPKYKKVFTVNKDNVVEIGKPLPGTDELPESKRRTKTLAERLDNVFRLTNNRPRALRD